MAARLSRDTIRSIRRIRNRRLGAHGRWATLARGDEPWSRDALFPPRIRRSKAVAAYLERLRRQRDAAMADIIKSIMKEGTP